MSNKLLNYSDSILRPHLKVMECNPESRGHFISPGQFEKKSYKLRFNVHLGDMVCRVYNLGTQTQVKGPS